MTDHDRLADQFEQHRDHLRAVAYRMLGSLAEAEDAVQETWLRLSRSDTSDVVNLRAWLSTVVGRICLDLLRTRKSRREEPLDTHVPDPVVSPDPGADPEHEAMLADSVGLALLVVLETLAPAERLAFVLHDMFAVPFDDIAAVLGRSPAGVRQLASRARRRVQDSAPTPDADLARQREAVGAFLSASRSGDFAALLGVLDPNVLLRADAGPGEVSRLVRGAGAVLERAVAFAARAPYNRLALVNGAPGIVAIRDGRVLAVMSFAVVDARIVEINLLADPARLDQLQLSLPAD